MKKNKSVSGKVHAHREEAEQRLAAKGTAAEQRSDVEARLAFHELQVQNEELRKAQSELEESRSRYSDLYDFAPVGYFTFDQQGLILEVNLTGTTLLGVERSALSKRPFVLFIAPEHQDAFYLHFRQVMQTGTRQSCEIKLIRKDGAWFHAQLTSMAGEDGKQNTSLCRTVVTDITERKQAEAEAQSLARLPEENPHPVIRVTSEGGILYANRPAGDLLAEMGCAAAGPLPEALLKGVRQVIAEGQTCEREITVPAGRVFSFIIASSRGVEQINLYGRDITEHKQLELARQNQREELQTILDSVPAMVFYKDTENRFIRTNRAIEDAMGFSKNELEGKSIFDLYPREQAEAYWRDDKEVLASGKAKYGIIEPMESRGGTLIVQTDKIPYVNEQGTVAGIIGFALDITAKRQAEESLRKAKDELELRVQERTAELARANKSLQLEIQERKRVHDIVVKQSLLLESFFRCTITPLMFLDRHFNVIRVNDAYARAFRQAAQELPGCNYFDIYPQSELKEIFKSVVATGEPFEAVAMPFTFPDRPKLGITYWNWTLTPLLNEHDEVESMVFSLQDVTETQQAHQGLEAASRYTRNLIEASLDPLFTISRDGKIMDANKAMELAIGFPREQIIGNDFSSYCTEPEKAREAYQQAFLNGFVQDYHLTIKHRSGAVMDILYNATVYKNSAGEIEGVFAAARNITERKRMENALLENEQRLKTAQGIAHLGSWELNLMSGEQLWSKEMYHIFGYDPQAITMTYDISFDAIYPEDEDYVRQSVREALEKGTAYNIDFRIIRIDGEVRYLNSQAELYMDEQGEALRMVGSVLDITDRKNIERELQESGQQLRFLSAQLLTAQEMERKRIAGEVHDELGQAMTVLKLRLRTIEKHLRKDQEKVRGECLDLLGYADGILKSVRRISRDLTPSILDDLGLSAAVRWLVNNFKENLDVNIALQAVNIDSLVPKDLQINIYRILQECLTNIGKHAQAKNITLSIRQQQDTILFTVEDDGRGFDPEQLFSEMAMAQGLGFTTMRERALILNGTLDISSRQGAGTCVTLLIPRGKGGAI